jgi:histidinol dehydrogenase
MARSIDIRRLIGEVAARDGIRIEPGDPAFALVTLNQLVLEDAIKQIGEHIHSGIAEFTEAVQKTESRAGKVLAEEVKEAAAEVREELQRDIEAARINAREILYETHRKYSRVALIRCAVGAIAAVAAVFASGVWVGTHLLH